MRRRVAQAGKRIGKSGALTRQERACMDMRPRCGCISTAARGDAAMLHALVMLQCSRSPRCASYSTYVGDTAMWQQTAAQASRRERVWHCVHDGTSAHMGGVRTGLRTSWCGGLTTYGPEGRTLSFPNLLRQWPGRQRGQTCARPRGWRFFNSSQNH